MLNQLRSNNTWELQSNLSSSIVPFFCDYPRWLLFFAAFCCVVFMLIGIPGNLITLLALYRAKKLRNATAIFIMNLSVSDLMFCCFNLPLATSTFWHGSWLHGPLLCRLYPLLRYGLVAVSLFTILAITINRYVMIGHPKLYPKIYDSKHLVIMVIVIWVAGFGILLATWFEQWGRFGMDPKIGSCSILPDSKGRNPKVFLFVIAFWTPCLAIVTCYARIFYIVRKTARKSKGCCTANACKSNLKANSMLTKDRASIAHKTSLPSPMEMCYSKQVEVLILEPIKRENAQNLGSRRCKSLDGDLCPKETLLAVPRCSSTSQRSHEDGLRVSTKDKKLLTMILMIFSSFLICYLPITISKTFKSSHEWRGLNIAGYLLIYLTTCINPVIYVVMSCEYRSAYRNLLLCRNNTARKNSKCHKRDKITLTAFEQNDCTNEKS